MTTKLIFFNLFFNFKKTLAFGGNANEVVVASLDIVDQVLQGHLYLLDNFASEVALLDLVVDGQALEAGINQNENED